MVLRLAEQRTPHLSAAVLDSRMLQSTPEAGSAPATMARSERRDRKVHMAVDTLEHLLALHVTPATEQNRGQVRQLTEELQKACCESVKLAFVDQRLHGRKGIGCR